MNSKKSNLQDIIKRAESDILQLVGEKRTQHILAVSRLAVYLADIFKNLGADIDIDEVHCAALLHDVAKNMDYKKLCSEYDIVLSEDDLSSPQTIHAAVGAYYARDKYSIPESVFSAIIKHTVGNAKMSLVDNIIFVSDYCEETRTHKECIETRNKLLKISDKDLCDALVYLEYIKCEILFKTVKYLSEKGDKIHSGTLLTLREVFENNRKRVEFCQLLCEYRDIAEKFKL